jgi:tryptophan synthase alpha chain
MVDRGVVSNPLEEHGMNKLDQRIKDVQDRGEKLLVSGVPVGYPDLEATRDIVDTYIKSGIDIVEFSMPSLDPYIDTQIIADSNVQALTLQPDLERHFDMLARVRGDLPDEPFYMMAYADVIQGYGVERFVKRLVELEIDALELPDSEQRVPELVAELDASLAAAGIYRTYILHHPFEWAFFDRIKHGARGITLLQSVADAEGKRNKVAPENADIIARMRRDGMTAAIIMGYGIRDPERVKEALKCGADGVIVGTAMIGWLEKGDISGLSDFIRQMKAATLPLG